MTNDPYKIATTLTEWLYKNSDLFVFIDADSAVEPFIEIDSGRLRKLILEHLSLGHGDTEV